jgi:biopolymer transport protein ExbD
MITRPFNFSVHLRSTSARLEATGFIDACLILIFFSVFLSPHILAPGHVINLPEASGAALDADVVTSVLTVTGSEMLIFEGRIYSPDSFQKSFAHRAAAGKGGVLLIRADQDVPTSLLAMVLPLARDAGFARVVIAARQEKPAEAGFE